MSDCRDRPAHAVLGAHLLTQPARAGSYYRLSARLLLLDVVAGQVTLDFTGVVELGDEFLEEVFLVWAPAHPRVTLQVAHLPSKLAAQFFGFARKGTALASPLPDPLPRGGEGATQRLA